MRRIWILGLAGFSVLLSGCGGGGRGTDTASGGFRVAMMPKITGIAYFNACQKGGLEAAKELGYDFTYDGPTRNDVDEQKRLLEQWIAQGYNAIVVAPNDPALVAPVLERARQKGILVVTYDADADRGRQYFANQASYDAIAQALLDGMAEEIGGEGKVGILTSTLQAPNQSQWARRMRERRAEKHPKIVLLDEYESQESNTLGVARAKDMIQAHPDLKGIVCLTSIAFPSAAEAVEQTGKKGQVKVVGLSTPNEMRKYVKSGTVRQVILWKPVDLGYLAVRMVEGLRKGELKPDGSSVGKFSAGRLGEVEVRSGGEVLLGPPMVFTRENIDDPGHDF